MVVRICKSAQQTMLREVRGSPVETGGVMVGIADPPIIVEAGSGGKNAIREAARFSGDTEADRACLERARRKHGEQISITGYFHKHPQGMSGWSGQDLSQAREITREFDDGKLVLVGIFTEKGHDPEPRLFLYGISSPDGELESVEYEVVPDDDASVRNALAKAVVIPEIKDSDFWSDSAFRFYENPIGRDRLRQELDELRQRGWTVTVGRVGRETGLRVQAKRRGKSLEARLPREYPINPPRLFLNGQGELIGLDFLRQWNSDRSLADLFQLGALVVTCPRCRRQHLVEQKEGVSHG